MPAEAFKCLIGQACLIYRLILPDFYFYVMLFFERGISKKKPTSVFANFGLGRIILILWIGYLNSGIATKT